jgi:peptidoglycan/xylan/chitin deacetylase (PgdA/CDA1 family)
VRGQGGLRLRSLVVLGLAATLAAPAVATASTPPVQVSMMRGADACVALTFDDGPDATLTPKLLSVLESKNAVATFFVVGSRVKTWPDPVAREATDGDEVGNHSWDHPALPSLASPAALSELTRTDDIISEVTGHVPDVTRAPYGSLSPRVAALSDRTYIAWSIDTLDWKYPDVDRITREALKATNGAIILLHDTHPKSVEAVPGIIDGLRQRGFRLVTVADLLSGSCGGTPAAYGVPAPKAVPATPPLVASAKPAVAAKPSAPATAPLFPVTAPVIAAAVSPAATPSKIPSAPIAATSWYVAQNGKSLVCVVTPTRPNGARYTLIGGGGYETVTAATAAMRIAAACKPGPKTAT